MQNNDVLQHPRVIVVQKLYSHHLNKESENRKNNQKEWNSSLAKKNISGDDINIIFYILVSDSIIKYAPRIF